MSRDSDIVDAILPASAKDMAKYLGHPHDPWITRGMSLAQKLEFHSMPEPNSGCRLWTAHVNEDGYGIMWWAGEMQKAHRLSWMAHRGPIPDGLEVCHHCDVPSCIEESDLFLGTHQENIDDMITKGRGRWLRGSNHASAILNEEMVQQILRSERPQRELARRFGVSKSTIAMIKMRRIWRHVT